MNKLKKLKKRHIRVFVKSFFWFSIGAILGLFFLLSFAFIIFQKQYQNVVYPGVIINGTNFGGKTQEQVKDFFAQKNTKAAKTTLTFIAEDQTATSSAQELNFGYDEDLLSKQAYTIGRSDNTLSNLTLIFQAYLGGVSLPASYHYSEEKLKTILEPIRKNTQRDAVDALFTFQNGKVSAFRLSQEGADIDVQKLHGDIMSKALLVLETSKTQNIVIHIPIKVIKPSITTDEANSLGIKELIGSGTSLFQHSIPNRIYNITLAATRLNGILVAPGEVFSFGKALGDVSAFTGYKQAYVIQDGKTVLGDGGGVCQVSTTFFRALLNAGLPILERHDHSYRVGYYEQDSLPGFDATVFLPNVDLRFKNDTNTHILIQTAIDSYSQRLTFFLYGAKDGRQVTISKPIITNETPAPPPLYQDDPTLPKGEVKQVDFAAPGANVSFTRQVVKDGKVIISDTFVSNYRPWQAVYLQGTKE